MSQENGQQDDPSSKIDQQQTQDLEVMAQYNSLIKKLSKEKLTQKKQYHQLYSCVVCYDITQEAMLSLCCETLLCFSCI